MLTKTINPADWLTALRQNGCKVTEAQATLVHIFAYSEYPLSAEQAWETARLSRPETGRATVYRIVEKLEGLGLLRRIHGYKGCSHFTPVLPEAAMLFICLRCQRVAYLDRQPLNDLVATAAQNSGHLITDSRIQMFGTCTMCLQQENPSFTSYGDKP
jgi:Fe2+ or Zn2+ uptake regulation protein